MLIELANGVGLDEVEAVKELDGLASRLVTLEAEAAALSARQDTLRQAAGAALGKAAAARARVVAVSQTEGEFGSGVPRGALSAAETEVRAATDELARVNRELRSVRSEAADLRQKHGRDIALLEEARAEALEQYQEERADVEGELERLGEREKTASASALVAVRREREDLYRRLLIVQDREGALAAALLSAKWRSLAASVLPDLREQVEGELAAARLAAEARPDPVRSTQIAQARWVYARELLADPAALWRTHLGRLEASLGAGTVGALRELVAEAVPNLSGYTWTDGAGRTVTASYR